ncbi:MAG: WG repeat-containing protein [Ruminococcus sp.]|nr:WG repeat-containing protein [Ruminococcus sp.]
MKKYKFMLVIPFVILIIAAWGNLGAGDEEMRRMLEERQQLIEEAEKFAEDRIYFRAAQKLEEARRINAGDEGEIELKLMEYYLADGDYKNWLNVGTERLRKKTADESEIMEMAEYYRGKQSYSEFLSVIDSGLELFPDSVRMQQARDSVKYSYSYGRCSFTRAAPSFGGSIAVESEGKWAFASAGGGNAGEYIYDEATSFGGKFAAVKKDGEVYLINSDFKRYSLCHDSTVDGLFLFDGSRAVVTAGDKFLLADEEMEIIGDLYDFIGSGSDKIYPAKKGDKWIFINSNGEQAISGEYEDIALNGKYSAFFNGIAFVKENGSYKMIDTAGETLNGSAFENAYPFMEKNSLAAVKQNGKWGFADTSGEIVIPCEYEGAKSFSCGLGAVKLNGKWGYISRRGELLIPAEYDEAEPFEYNKAIVYSGGYCGFITLDYYG